MLYFYKSRIHGQVQACDSDMVVAERTRFDGPINVHYYGTVLNSEIMSGMSVTGTSLYDSPNCNGVFLRGFMNSFICGNLCGPCGAQFWLDGVSNWYFCDFNFGSVSGGACLFIIESTRAEQQTCYPPEGCGISSFNGLTRKK